MHKIAKIFQALSYWPIYGTLRIFAHFKIEGQENLMGLEKRAVIFASNHASIFDGPICAASMPRGKGDFYPKKFFPIRFLAAEEFFGWKYLLIAFYVWINGSIPIKRGLKAGDKDLKDILAEPIKELERKEKIWIFPEGKVSRRGLIIRKGKRGVAFLQRATGAPIVPVLLIGTRSLYSPLALLGLKRVMVRIGKPIFNLNEPDLKKASQIVMNEIRKLADQ